MQLRTDDLPIRPAATVLLVREAESGLSGSGVPGSGVSESGVSHTGVEQSRVEVFALRRVTAMAFAGGVTAFPGGAVDPGDDLADARWSGSAPAWWTHQLGVDEPAARRLVVAAVRELFEETGVQLLRPRAGLTEEDRLEILGRRRTFDAALAGAGCVLDSALLRPWANWVTPPGRSRRYDTFFFLAVLPEGQQARLLTTEADVGQWVRPDALLSQAESGTVAIMPPTRAMLTDLAAASSVADLLAARRTVTPVHFDDPRRTANR